MRRLAYRLFPLLLAAPLAVSAQGVVRHPLPHGSTFPIAAAVEVPPGKTLVFLSGSAAPMVNPKAPKGSIEAYGDTETQTVGTLKNIQAELKSMGLSMGDVIKMNAYLVGDPSKGGKMDFAGFMKGYTQFFGTKEQPNLPVRTALQVASLAGPGLLIEIEVTAVRP